MDQEMLSDLLNEAQRNIYGFTNLINVTQGMMIGFFSATGKVPTTNSMSETITLAHDISDEYSNMTSAWGYEA
jgi:hypothetical protein